MSTNILSRLVQINAELNRYELPFVLFIGLITNVINLMIFSRRQLRENVCSLYFLCLSLIHLLFLLIMCSQTALTPWTGYNISSNLVIFCKIRQYLFDLLTSLTRHVICLISVDRWMITSSNVWIRQQSSLRLGRYLVVMSVIFWSLFNIHSLIEFNIISNICTTSVSSKYFFFYSIYSIIITISPMILMIGFSMLTLRNLHPNRVVAILSVNSIVNNPRTNVNGVIRRFGPGRSQRDIHFIRLSVIQVVSFLVFNSIWTAFPLHLFIMSSRANRTLDERFLSAILFGFGLNLLYTYAAVCFFFI